MQRTRSTEKAVGASLWGQLLFSQNAAYILIIVLSVWLIYLFGFREMRFFLVPSSSMVPTLFETDQIVTLKEKTYHRGDIVVLREKDKQGYLVKRIVAFGGDRVLIQGGALFLNGAPVAEPYLPEPMHYKVTPAITIPEGEVYILGDNRNYSEDSSLNGETYALKDIVGKVRFIYYPYDRFGQVASFLLPTAEDSATLAGL